ncbi:hypothetical protein F0562_005412 [Nyssa sinensis]|uniref:Protein FAR1-RELATED SEQUENCE n=1 Tax=Nyssa sinensis TaxID=561372 RepID=A0A5J5AK22_9ASTE|nr:hypothetical protein F0562_005412 [Nyssa sinensis]
MTISRWPDGKCCVIHFEANHNHEVVSIEEIHSLPSHRKVTVAQAIEVDLEESCEIHQKLTSELLDNQENFEYLPTLKHSKQMKGMKEGEAGGLYEVSSFGRPPHRTVTFNSSDNIVNCNCMKFESSGVLCGHSLKVLDVRNIKVVPENYILKRWTKGARVESVTDAHGCMVQDDPKMVPATHDKDLSQKAIKPSMWAAESEEGYHFLNRILRRGCLDWKGFI